MPRLRNGSERVPAALPTQPRRQFSAKDLADAGRAERRKLVHVLLTERGGRVVETNAPAAYDEFIVELTPFWMVRRLRVRVAARQITQVDVDRLSEAVAAAGDMEGVLVACVGRDRSLAGRPNVSLVDAGELVARITRCALLSWEDGRPIPAYSRVASMQRLEREAAILDPVGIRWLPTLALNELPVELSDSGLTPQDLLERLAFRLLTSCLRFGGRRYGEAERGRRLPDSVINWPSANANRYAALVDCKAASSGYVMDSDHELRFQRYADDLRRSIEQAGYDLRYLIVVSSSFPGRSGRRHPFHARAKKLMSASDVRLAYVQAHDLSETALTVEATGMSPLDREQLSWDEPLAEGLVTAASLRRMVGGDS